MAAMHGCAATASPPCRLAAGEVSVYKDLRTGGLILEIKVVGQPPAARQVSYQAFKLGIGSHIRHGEFPTKSFRTISNVRRSEAKSLQRAASALERCGLFRVESLPNRLQPLQFLRRFHALLALALIVVLRGVRTAAII